MKLSSYIITIALIIYSYQCLFTFAVEHVTYVDHSPSSKVFLFRGGEIVQNNGSNLSQYNLDYKGLHSAITLAAKQANVDLPSQFYIIDINLTNLNDTADDTAGDALRTITEFEFWNKNPNLGKFIFWQTFGTYDNASDPNMSTSMRAFLTLNLEEWQNDMLIRRIDLLHEWLLKSHSQETIVIYGHCDCGCDRTGETFGSYYMKWMNKSWEEVNALNTKIAGRPMGCTNWLAMQWYCLHLNAVHGKHLNCLKHFPCTSF